MSNDDREFVTLTHGHTKTTVRSVFAEDASKLPFKGDMGRTVIRASARRHKGIGSHENPVRSWDAMYRQVSRGSSFLSWWRDNV